MSNVGNPQPDFMSEDEQAALLRATKLLAMHLSLVRIVRDKGDVVVNTLAICDMQTKLGSAGSESIWGYFLVSEEHMQAALSLLSNPLGRLGSSALSLMRISAEAAARAWWLMVPESQNLRLGRMATDELHRIRAWIVLEDEQQLVIERKNILARVAEEANLSEIRSSQHRLMGYGEVERPNSTDLFGEIGKASNYLDEEHMRWFYRMASTNVHGRMAKVYSATTEIDELAGEYSISVRPNGCAFGNVVTTAILVHRVAFETLIYYGGLDTTLWSEGIRTINQFRISEQA